MSEKASMLSGETDVPMKAPVRSSGPVAAPTSPGYSQYVDNDSSHAPSTDGGNETVRRSSVVSSNISEAGGNAKSEPQAWYYGYDVLILLFLLGLTTGVINGCISWIIKLLSTLQARILTSGPIGPFYFLMTTTFLTVVSAFIIKQGGMKATYGAGMPEVKALLVSDFHLTEFPNIVSAKIFALRVSSLITAVGAGVSIGVAAPLVHASLCTAYCFMRFISYFRSLMDNPAMLKQIFAASAAVGMSTVFNSPVGGLLFSIEVTSTYYLISNYWRSFMAATTGAVMYNIFLSARDTEGRIFQIDTVTNPYDKWEYAAFVFLGLICGVLAYIYLRVHQAYYMTMRKLLTDHPIATAGVVGAITSLLIYAANAHSSAGVSEMVIVKDLFKNGEISEMHSRDDVSRLGGLFASLVVRVFLTIIGTTLRVSAGVFLPMFTIGALVGRVFGQILNAPGSTVYIEGYAMVGAAAFLSGTTHTISAAVIVVEMTGEIDMLLPCLIGAVIACGITKTRTLSLYDQGMVNKGLESFELLLETTGGFNFAADVMDSQVISVTRKCTVGDLFTLLNNDSQSTFPVIDTADSCHLVGSVERRDIFQYLKEMFTQQGEGDYVNRVLVADVEAEALYEQRNEAIARHESWLRRMNTDSVPGSGIARRLFPSSYALTTMDNSTTSVDSGWGGAGVGETPMRKSTNPMQKIDAGGVKINIADAAPSNAALVETLMAHPVDVLLAPDLPTNGFPFTAHRQSTMDQLYVLFEMVKVKVVFVVAEDKTLEGMISKDLLLESLKKKVN